MSCGFSFLIFQIIKAFTNIITFLEILLICVSNTFSHSIVKVNYRLTAMLVILIGLNCNSRKSSVSGV